MDRIANTCPRCGRPAKRTHAYGRVVRFFCEPCNTRFKLSYTENEEDCELEELNTMYESMVQYAGYLVDLIAGKNARIRKLEEHIHRHATIIFEEKI